MATYKCKMCGGDLSLIAGSTVCECEFCGTRQTVPTADDEKKMTLFNRANRLRFNNEFDKAFGVYESIIAEFPEEAEAYWGLILCKYGIEYVDDPATGKKIPTCHRSSFDSIFDDQNFEMVMEYSDSISKRVYREEAKQIEELRKSIIEVSSKEEPYDIFICYKETDENGDRTLDSVLAQDIYKALTDEGYRVFFSRISLEDKLGVEYEPYIFAALHSAKVMLAVGTQYEYYDAVWVKNEWGRFLQLIANGEKKTLIPVYKNLDAYDMPKEFARLQAQDMGKVGALQDLLRGIDKILNKGAEKGNTQAPAADTGVSILNAQTSALLKRGYMCLEDKDFEKAADFFEQVLNNDPECGQAYWGKVLCAYKATDASKLASALLNKLINISDTEELVFPIHKVNALKEAAGDSGMLNGFSDEELEELLDEIEAKPLIYKSNARIMKNADKQLEQIDQLKDIIANRNYERALQYQDSEIAQNVSKVQQFLRQGIAGAIQEDEEKKTKTEKEADAAYAELKTELEGKLSSVRELYESKKEEIKQARAKAEEEAECAYQNAVSDFETNYDKRVREWNEAKQYYQANYASAIKKSQQLSEKIKQLETEKNELKGLFSGRRRKELEENIAVLTRNMKDIIIPSDPGAMPEKGTAPERSAFKALVLDIELNLNDPLIEVLKPSERRKKKLLKFLSSFGKYSYSSKNDVKPIEWKVLDVQNGKALLLSSYGLEAKPFNTNYKDVRWERCTLRKWLNSDFLNTAFNAEERKLILETRVAADKNPRYPTDPGNATTDRVFLLSISEAEKYFKNDAERMTNATPYANSNGAYKADNGNCWWWLRSPGYSSDIAAFVNYRGSIDEFGDSVKRGKGVVRPALWVDYTNL